MASSFVGDANIGIARWQCARGYHYRILAALDEFGVASQAELGRRSNMDRSGVVAAINELAEQGFVERTPDPDDRRRNIVTLTTAGNRQPRRMDRALDKVQDDLSDACAPHEAEAAVPARRLVRMRCSTHANSPGGMSLACPDSAQDLSRG